MDDAVIRAVARWPDVPAVYGWLRLTGRGEWRIKGEPVVNPALAAFIGRNYASDGRGRWYFQNGPQRVFATLDYTPWVYRIAAAGAAGLALACHTGAAARRCDGAWLDDRGGLLLLTEHGVGTVSDRDLPDALAALRRADGAVADDALLCGALDAAARGGDTGLALLVAGRRVRVGTLAAAVVARRFGFDPDPRPGPGEPAC